MNRVDWKEKVRSGCKSRKRSADKMVFCVYCRKHGGVCEFGNCPKRGNAMTADATTEGA